MFSATTSGGVGRCTVHQELRSNDGTPCVADEEAGDLVLLKYWPTLTWSQTVRAHGLV